MTYRVFVRNWWKPNPSWPDGREPDSTARKTTISRKIQDEETARRICREYNASHPAGPLSRKAEYEEEGR